MATEIIQMKISLDWIKPEIWRRFVVDSAITLDDLHDIIQIVMGWTNSHLYGFAIGDSDYSPASDDFEFDGEDTKGVALKKLKLKDKQKFRYVYDFGDDWQHTVTIEKIWHPEENIQTPYCLDGARNCPPDDCGSIPGYEDIVNAMKKPKSKEAKEFVDWLGEPYDPEKFDKDEINTIFKPAKKKTRKKAGG